MRRLLLPVLIMVSVMVLPAGAVPYNIDNLVIKINNDGSANITLSIQIPGGVNNITNITVQTLGSPIFAEAVAPNGTLLPVRLLNESVVVTLLPNISYVKLNYITLDLTEKKGIKWIIKYSLPYTSKLILPDNAVPSMLLPEPRITTENNSIVFIFPPGNVTVEYILTPPVPEQPGTGGGQDQNNTGNEAPSGETSGQTGTDVGKVVALLILLLIISIIIYYLIRRKDNPIPPVSLEKTQELDERDKKILSILENSPDGLTASEIMAATGIPKTPLYRRLNKLVKKGLIEYYDEGGVRRYRLPRK